MPFATPSAPTSLRPSSHPGVRAARKFGLNLIQALRSLGSSDLQRLAHTVAAAGPSVTLNDNPAASYDIGKEVTALLSSVVQGGGLDFSELLGSFTPAEEREDRQNPSPSATDAGDGLSGILQGILDKAVEAHFDDTWGYSIDEFLQDVVNLLDMMSSFEGGLIGGFTFLGVGALAAYVDSAVLGGAVLNVLTFGIEKFAEFIALYAYAATMAGAILTVIVIAVLIVVLISEIVNHWTEITDFFGGVFSEIGDFFSAAWEVVTDAAESVWDAVCEAASAFWNWVTGGGNSSGDKKGSIIWSSKPPPRPNGTVSTWPWFAYGGDMFLADYQTEPALTFELQIRYYLYRRLMVQMGV